jgi:hypothetical protein
MGAVIEHILRLPRLEHLVGIALQISRFFIDSTKYSVAASKGMEVCTQRWCIVPVLQLSHKAVQVQFLAEQSIQVCRGGEELGHHEEICVLGPSCLEEILADMDGGRMGIIESESIGNLSHRLGVLGHMLPQVRRISRTSSISELDIISPDIDSPAKVMPSHHREVFHAIVIHYPSIVSHFRLL